jgi:purine nucleoside phosphorylase
LTASQSLVTPERYLAYLRDRGVAAADLAVAPTVVLAWGPLVRPLADDLAARRRRAWPYDEDWPYHEAGELGVARLPTGAPAAVFLADQLIACGAGRLIVLGIAGSLVPSLPPGRVVIAAEAIASDGTSPHYGVSTGAAIPSLGRLPNRVAAALGVNGVETSLTTVWTTDAPFRETAPVLERARATGACAVEMETAALYALAAHRGVEACAVLVVTDCIWGSWRPAFELPEVGRALGRVRGALPAAVTTLG